MNISVNLYFTTLLFIGELHVPLEVCGAVVKRELDYWHVDEFHIKSCCWRHYRSYIENKRILDSFNRSLLKENFVIDLDSHAGWKRIQMRLWLVLEHPRTSKAAMVSSNRGCQWEWVFWGLSQNLQKSCDKGAYVWFDLLRNVCIVVCILSTVPSMLVTTCSSKNTSIFNMYKIGIVRWGVAQANNVALMHNK